MRRSFSLRFAALAAGLLFTLPAVVGAANLDLDHINVRYHGGALLGHVRVSTLFWGQGWDQEQSDLARHFNQFFQDLFADGRYMANLSQYSRDGYQIGNGEFVTTLTDSQALAERVTDEQIQAEIRAQITAGKLPAPQADSLYVVFTPPAVVVEDGRGGDSAHNFGGYHEYASSWDGSAAEFAYAVIPYNDFHRVNPGQSNPRMMTDAVSHELAEAVTDPEPDLQLTRGGGWYDEVNGEIGDIPIDLYDDLNRHIGLHDVFATLPGSQGRPYLVQKVWSNRDGAPVAFAQTAGN